MATMTTGVATAQTSISDLKHTYNRHVLCRGFFDAIQVESYPSLDCAARTQLETFQSHKLCRRLPATLCSFLTRRKIHRFCYHLYVANLELCDLECFVWKEQQLCDATTLTVASLADTAKKKKEDNNEHHMERILVPFMRDCQDVWCAFCLYTAADTAKGEPLPDPPVYSLSNEDFSWQKWQLLQQQSSSLTTTTNGDAPTSTFNGNVCFCSDDLKRKFQRHLVLENPRLSTFLEEYGKESLSWGPCNHDCDSDNSSSDDDDEVDACRNQQNDQDRDTSQETPDDDNDGTIYQDYGIRMETVKGRKRRPPSASSEEAEWKG